MALIGGGAAPTASRQKEVAAILLHTSSMTVNRNSTFYHSMWEST